MDRPTFIKILASDSRDYSNRPLLVNSVIKNKSWILILLHNINDIENNNSSFSARILELSCKKELGLLLPYLDEFVAIIPKLKLDASIRASAKIIELLTIKYFLQKADIYRNSLTNSHLELFTENCFDWMINKKAIAIQAHSMYALYLMGKIYDWVHPELITMIERNLPKGSAGYKNRGKKVINAIKTNITFKL